jgi:Na+/melibiose symporter-like transporter
VQAPIVITKLLWLAIAPGVLFTLGALFASYRFKMSEADVEEVRKKLQARRNAKAALDDQAEVAG